MAKLRRVKLEGFKSIRSLDLDLRPLNIMVGVNGAGKSNLISFFKMLNELIGGRLQNFVATAGRAQSLLYFGPKITPQIHASLEFDADTGLDTYYVRLFHAAEDSLAFAEEKVSFLAGGFSEPKSHSLGAGHLESKLGDAAEQGEPIAKVIRYLLSRCRVFHFHDTSATAPLRHYCYVGDDRWLMPDGGNLAAFLFRLRNQDQPVAFRRIRATIRQIAPFFDDFDLEPSGSSGKDIILNWRQKNSDRLFGPHQLSDGTLRAMALVALLHQPRAELPELIVIDEPELGLHPAARTVIAELFQKAATACQVIVATQSAAILDMMSPEDVVVVENKENQSTFQRLDAKKLEAWLSEYTLGQLWQKNVIGGGPFS